MEKLRQVEAFSKVLSKSNWHIGYFSYMLEGDMISVEERRQSKLCVQFWAKIAYKRRFLYCEALNDSEFEVFWMKENFTFFVKNIAWVSSTLYICIVEGSIDKS